jgi:hypothetical protein
MEKRVHHFHCSNLNYLLCEVAISTHNSIQVHRRGKSHLNTIKKHPFKLPKRIYYTHHLSVNSVQKSYAKKRRPELYMPRFEHVS